MNTFEDLIGSKEFLTALAVLVAGGVFTAAVKWYRDNRDGKKIYTFLLEPKAGTEWTFRSTHAISSHTKISEAESKNFAASTQRSREMKKKSSPGGSLSNEAYNLSYAL